VKFRFTGKAETHPVAGDDAKQAALFTQQSLLPELAFDHALIISDYFKAKELY
jgi:8-oxo-dGTP diphosphatase